MSKFKNHKLLFQNNKFLDNIISNYIKFGCLNEKECKIMSSDDSTTRQRNNIKLQEINNDENTIFMLTGDGTSDVLLNTDPKDDRLFWNEILYCEGREKCYLRGKLHGLLLFVFPILLWWYYEAGKGNPIGLSICLFYLMMNFITFLVSASFHLGRWSKRTEIILQKIDHCMVAIYVMSKYFPMSLLLLPDYIGLSHFFLVVCITIWNNYYVWHSNSNSLRLVALAGVQLPFLYFYYQYMSDLEWAMNWVAVITQIIAGYIFTNELTPSWFNPDIATYHEVYHIISAITGGAMWVLNWSILKRTTNMN